MKLFWSNKCIENNYRCPNCQTMLGDKNGQMPIDSKNHKIEWLSGQVKCVVCGITIGYFPHKSVIQGHTIRQGMTSKTLSTVKYVIAVEQKEF